jgi:hypothetical protein
MADDHRDAPVECGTDIRVIQALKVRHDRRHLSLTSSASARSDVTAFVRKSELLPQTGHWVVNEGHVQILPCLACDFRGERSRPAGSLFLLAFQRAQRCANNLTA